MILDLDIGNSRIKWLIHGSGQNREQGVCADAAELIALLENRRFKPSLVRASCVRNPEPIEKLDGWLLGRGLGQCIQAQTRASAGPVTCGYEVPGQMGVDRWLAVCASWHRIGAACVVVDAGSALTIDFVDAAARHLGGYIVPGVSLQQSTLLQATEKVRFRGDETLESLGPGTNTGQAVRRGVLRMFAGLIEGALGDFERQQGEGVALLLTGGDASLIGPFLDIDYLEVPDLVLEGIDVVMAAD